jgi:hypothetical protein
MLHVVILLLAALRPDDPVVHLKFDGTVEDSGKAALPVRAEGRLEYVDSPVGATGRAAVFNGVDAFVRVDPPDTLGAGSGSFSVSAWVVPLDRRPMTILARKGWSLELTDGAGVQFKSEVVTITAPAGACPPGQWTHVLVSLDRGSGDGLSTLYVNGLTVGPGETRQGNLDVPKEPLLIGRGPDNRLFTGLIDDVRLYDRALDGRGVQSLIGGGMPWLQLKKYTTLPFPGRFELLDNDVVAFLGGEDARVGQDLGYLETLLAVFAAGKHVRFRNMAWEGDTVYEQPRPLNFGSWADQFRRVGASVLVLQFGQVESLQGKDGVSRFEGAYEALLAQLSKSTQRIVLVSPAPFAKGAPGAPDLAARNGDLASYVEAVRRIAKRHEYLFVDLTTPALSQEGMSRDGLHLTNAGQWAAAREIARQLEVPGLSDLESPDPRTGEFRKGSLEALRSAIRVKDGLWTSSWRPSNWAFLNGDRMEQPSSRDHVDRRVRWFPVEIQTYPALIRRQEDKIESLTEKR